VLSAWQFRLQQKQGLREETARHYFQQLVVALDYCHSLGIAMRDVKVHSSLNTPHCSYSLQQKRAAKECLSHPAALQRPCICLCTCLLDAQHSDYCTSPQ
jgi:serine/threonine protein kinase